MVPSPASGEYRELAELKQSSAKVLKAYAQQFAGEDRQFEGIIQFGRSLGAVTDPTKIDVAKLTYQSKNDWRAVLEMTPSDPSILLVHGHLHAARGETDYADAYFLLASVTLDKSRRAELDAYKQYRNALSKRTAQELDKGIKLHDAGQYTKAIEVYDSVVAEHPNCARAYYEKGFAYVMMRKDNPAMKQKADEMYGECRRRAPFFWKAYQGGDPKVIEKLKVCLEKVEPFVSGKQRTKEGLAAFAEGCEAMELYPFAAHARWQLAMLDSQNFTVHMKKFLDMIEKSGCEDPNFFRQQFKLGDHAPAKPGSITPARDSPSRPSP